MLFRITVGKANSEEVLFSIAGSLDTFWYLVMLEENSTPTADVFEAGIRFAV